MSLILEAIENLFKKPFTEKVETCTKEKEFFVRGKIVVDIAKCTGCALCERVCPSKAIVMKNDERTKLKKSPRINISKCIFCGLCVDYCPTKALSFSKNQFLFSNLKEFYSEG